MKSHPAIAVAIVTLSGNYACADAFNSASFVSTSASLHQAERKDVAARSMQKQFALNMAEDRDYTSPMRQRPRPEGGDVAYTNENILRQLRHYNDIREVGGSDCVQDIYARDPNQTAGDKSNNVYNYWFIGKVARCTGTVSAEAAILRQLNMIEEHACRIRPIELGRHFGSLQFYAAPGDTELLTSQNDPRFRLVKVDREVGMEGEVEKVPLLEVGLNLELVTNMGKGFCVVRTEEGVVPPHLIGG